MAKVKLEFDDSTFTLLRARHTLLQSARPRYYHGRDIAKILRERQEGRCALCGRGKLGQHPHIDHKRTVKSLAYDLTISLDEAVRRCVALGNLRLVHAKCNWARNRKRRAS
jgi:hypothetical protein